MEGAQTTRRLILVLPLLAVSILPAQGQVNLPTPMDHYASFDADLAGGRLLNNVVSELNPAGRIVIGQFMAPRPAGTPPAVPRADALALLRSLDLGPHRLAILDLLLHTSSALDVVPDQASDWVPVVHDALLFFLDGLGDERLFERILNQVYMPAGAPRGARLLEFTDRTPALQKIGQILARNTDLSADIRQSLQNLENGMSTSNRDELVAFIETELGPDTIDAHQIRLDDEILAEASVGAVIRATLSYEATNREVVFKIVKPYVLDALPRELAVIDELASFLETQGDFYGLGDVPLSDMFRDVQEALSSEIRIEDEQGNLGLAEAYYTGSAVTVPHLYPFSTERVTVMDFIRGEKITDALAGNPAGRRELARRLADALTIDAIFSPTEEAIFHGDPHAGNVFHVSSDPADRYRIALLDWGLYGSFPRPQRRQLVQLVLGVHLGNEKRVRNNAGALLERGLPTSPEDLAKIRSIVDEVVEDRQGIFDTLQDLILRLANEGFQTRFNIALFIKSQITISGILKELDPAFDPDEHLLDRVNGLVWREFPKHLLYVAWFPAWNSHSYRSMLSNEDIRDVWTHGIVGVFGAIGRGLARGFGAIF